MSYPRTSHILGKSKLKSIMQPISQLPNPKTSPIYVIFHTFLINQNIIFEYCVLKVLVLFVKHAQ